MKVRYLTRPTETKEFEFVKAVIESGFLLQWIKFWDKENNQYCFVIADIVEMTITEEKEVVKDDRNNSSPEQI